MSDAWRRKSARWLPYWEAQSVNRDAGFSAAQYITKLPKAEHDAEEWQAAMEISAN